MFLRQLNCILDFHDLNGLLRIIVLAHLTDVERLDLLGVLWCHERPCLGRMNVVITFNLSSFAINSQETVGLRSYFLHSTVFEPTRDLLEGRLAVALRSLICVTCVAILILSHLYQFFLLNIQIHSIFDGRRRR